MLIAAISLKIPRDLKIRIRQRISQRDRGHQWILLVFATVEMVVRVRLETVASSSYLEARVQGANMSKYRKGQLPDEGFVLIAIDEM